MLYSNIIKQVSLLGSSICNLQCKYCYLHNQKTQNFYKILNDEVQNSWINHTYVANIKKVFEKIGANPKKTSRLGLWGGEPLIQIENFLQSSEELFNFFPNVDFFMIPTNFAWSEKIAEKIPIMISQFDTTRKVNEAEIHLQLSIDSYRGILLKEGHHAQNEQYLKNFETLIKGLSNIELKNTQIYMDIHSTASGENILKYLSTYEQIQDYLDGMLFLNQFANNLIEQYNCKNKIIYGNSAYFPLCAVPENSTSEDGYKYVEILKKAEKLQYENKYLSNAYHAFGEFAHNWRNQQILTANHECPESNYNAIMILPDGTISECACSYVANRQEYLDLILEQQQYEDYRLSMTRKKYFFNPLTASKEEEEFNDWYNLQGLRHNYSTALNLAMSLCQELSLSKQISPVYAMDPLLLLKHLHQESSGYSCTREQLYTTGIPFLPIPGDYRRMFNGEMEYANSVINSEYQIIIKDWMKHEYT